MAGVWPMATKSPFTSSVVDSSPVFTVSRSRTPVDLLVAEDVDDDLVPQHLDVLVVEDALLHHLLDARSSSRRWMMETFEANLAR